MKKKSNEELYQLYAMALSLQNQVVANSHLNTISLGYQAKAEIDRRDRIWTTYIAIAALVVSAFSLGVSFYKDVWKTTVSVTRSVS